MKGRSRGVNRYSKEGNLIDSFVSITKAANAVGSQPAAIIAAMKNDGLTGGYRFRYTEENLLCLEEHTRKRSDTLCKVVQQLTLEGELITEYPSTQEAMRQVRPEAKSKGGAVVKCCEGKLKSAYGYLFKYKEA